jgi:hypothetical protein
MAITLQKIVNSPKEYTTLSEVRESILAAAKAAKAADRHDSVVIELDPTSYNITEPFVLSATENPELSAVDITRFHCVNSSCVYATVTENISQTHNVLLQTIISACEKMTEVMRKDFLFRHVRRLT